MSAHWTHTSISTHFTQLTGNNGKSYILNQKISIPDGLVLQPGANTNDVTDSEKLVAKITAFAIIRTKYDTDCFYPTTAQVLALINIMMPFAIKYARVSCPGQPLIANGNGVIAWDAITIPVPLTVQNLCVKHIKTHNKRIEKHIKKVLTMFCLPSDLDDTRKANIIMLYLKPTIHTNAFYHRRTADQKVLMDDEGQPSVGYRSMEHIAIYHDLVGVHSQYPSSIIAKETGPRNRWFTGLVVQEIVKFIRGLLDESTRRMCTYASLLGISKDNLLQEEQNIRATPAFIAATNGTVWNTNHYSVWDRYGNVCFMAYCLETITTVAIYFFAMDRLQRPKLPDRVTEFLKVLNVLHSMPPVLFQHHKQIIIISYGNQMPTQPGVPVVVYESLTLFTPISLDVDEGLQRLRELPIAHEQVKSELEVLEQANVEGVHTPDVMVTGPEPIDNMLGLLGATLAAGIEITLWTHVSYRARWSHLFVSAEPMGLEAHIASKLLAPLASHGGVPNPINLNQDLQLAIIAYYGNPTPDALEILFHHLDYVCPYAAGIFGDVEQCFNLHMDLDITSL